jgi:hypothetical protein
MLENFVIKMYHSSRNSNKKVIFRNQDNKISHRVRIVCTIVEITKEYNNLHHRTYHYTDEDRKIKGNGQNLSIFMDSFGNVMKRQKI